MRRLLLVATAFLVAGIAIGLCAPALTAEAPSEPDTTIETVEISDDGQYLKVIMSDNHADAVHTTKAREGGPNPQLSEDQIKGSGWALIPLSYSSQSTIAGGCGYARDGNTTVQVWDADHGFVDTHTLNISAQVDTCEGGQ